VPSEINHKVLERGVAFSNTNSTPAVTDMFEMASSKASGSFSVTLTGLETNMQYYARAYIRTLEGYSYGNTVSFTPNRGVSVVINYRTSEGWQIGKQTITAAIGNTLTGDAITVPTGFVLVGTFSYNVPSSGGSATATVRRIHQGAYMEGTSGYRFEPDRPITRIEVARMIHALRGNSYAGEGLVFSDMPGNPADIEAIRFVSAMGFMVGDAGGTNIRTFRPSAPIKREEIATILCNIYGLTLGGSNVPSDVKANHWSTPYIAATVREKIFVGFEDGSFRPTRDITKAETLAVFQRAENLGETPLGTTQFVDVPPTHWAHRLIMSAAIPRP
jgi:hypothetical protein